MTSEYCTPADVLERLRLATDHPDAAYVAECTTVACELIDDRSGLSWTSDGVPVLPAPPYPRRLWRAAIGVATDVYRYKDREADTSGTWGTAPAPPPQDPEQRPGTLRRATGAVASRLGDRVNGLDDVRADRSRRPGRRVWTPPVCRRRRFTPIRPTNSPYRRSGSRRRSVCDRPDPRTIVAEVSVIVAVDGAEPAQLAALDELEAAAWVALETVGTATPGRTDRASSPAVRRCTP